MSNRSRGLRSTGGGGPAQRAPGRCSKGTASVPRAGVPRSQPARQRPSTHLRPRGRFSRRATTPSSSCSSVLPVTRRSAPAHQAASFRCARSKLPWVAQPEQCSSTSGRNGSPVEAGSFANHSFTEFPGDRTLPAEAPAPSSSLISSSRSLKATVSRSHRGGQHDQCRGPPVAPAPCLLILRPGR